MENKINKKLIYSIIITLIYAFITLICVLHHEVWADEAQVWQLCKYLSIPELFHHLHNEGHPAFFYLLVMPFAKIFNDIIWMKLLCWGGVVCSVFLLLYYSPFKTFTKFAVILSAGFIYFFPVIARSYSIIPFLIFLAAILYEKQKQFPVLYAIILSAIASTHAIMFGFSFILGILFFWDNIIKNKTDRKKFFISCIIIILGFLYVIWQLHDTTSNNYYIKFNFENLGLKIIKLFFFFFINSFNRAITITDKFSIYDIFFILALIFIYATALRSLYLNSKKLFGLFILSIGFQFGIYIFAYSVHTYVTRIFCAHAILLFCFWVLINEKKLNTNYKICTEKGINIILSLFFILTSYNGIIFYLTDMQRAYAPAINTYKFIKQNLKPEDIILIDNEAYTISLIYYLDKDNLADNIIQTIRNRNTKYVVWDNDSYLQNSNSSWYNLLDYIKHDIGILNDIYIIKGYKIPGPEKPTLDSEYPKDFKLIYQTNEGMVLNEKHLVYKYIGK